MACSGVSFTFTFYRVEVGQVVLQGLRFYTVGVIPLMLRVCTSFVCRRRYTILAVETPVKLRLLSPTNTLTQPLIRSSFEKHFYIRTGLDWVYTHSKVKCPVVQALRLCTGRTAHRGSRGIALLFLDHGTKVRTAAGNTKKLHKSIEE